MTVFYHVNDQNSLKNFIIDVWLAREKDTSKPMEGVKAIIELQFKFGSN